MQIVFNDMEIEIGTMNIYIQAKWNGIVYFLVLGFFLFFFFHWKKTR